MSVLDFLKTNRTTIAEQRQEIEDLQCKIKGSEEELIALADEKRDLKSQINNKEDVIHDLGKEIDKIKSDRDIQINEMNAEKTANDAKIASDRKIHDEKMEHLVKCKTEALEITHDKKVVELERKSASEIATVKDKYQDKLVKQLEKETQSIKEMYAQILERLPNLNASMHLGGQKEADKSDNG